MLSCVYLRVSNLRKRPARKKTAEGGRRRESLLNVNVKNNVLKKFDGCYFEIEKCQQQLGIVEIISVLTWNAM